MAMAPDGRTDGRSQAKALVQVWCGVGVEMEWNMEGTSRRQERVSERGR